MTSRDESIATHFSAILRGWGRPVRLALAAAFLALFSGPAWSQPGAASSDNHGHGSLDEVGRKLANPVSDVWALFTEFDLGFNSGNGDTNGQNAGQDYVFFQTLVQPIMPIKLSDTPGSIERRPPLHGEHTDEILHECGIGAAEIARLREAEVV